MNITVELFSVLAMAAGVSSCTLELCHGATVQDAVEAMIEKFGNEFGSRIYNRNKALIALFIVSDYNVNLKHKLLDGDNLAILPPVAGG